MNRPKVSVVMPVYNGQRFVREAIDSVLAQSFSDYELLIINDASTDASREIIRTYRDPRVRLIENTVNLGIAGTRNVGLAEAVGEYVAWLDSDDVSLPTRLTEQVEFLDRHTSVALCGSWVKTTGDKMGDVWRYPTEGAVLRSRMLFDDPVATSAAMIRRQTLLSCDLRFDDRLSFAEDYDLWERISQYAELANIPKVLTLYRVHSDQISHGDPCKAKRAVWEVQRRQLLNLGVTPTELEKELHLTIGVGWHFLGDRRFVDACAAWLHRLSDANGCAKVYPEEAFKSVLAERWYGICRAASRHGFFAWRQFWDSPLAGEWNMSIKGMARFWATCALGEIRTCDTRHR